jgi:N-acetylglucosaminyl-diphospho-decaprenol L-rhamnosyltransferase
MNDGDGTGIDLSILVVSFETVERTVACVRSILTLAPPVRFEILLLDNRSRDGTLDRLLREFGHLPEVILASGRSNLGFARANNILGTAARGRWLLLLNPDAEATPGAIGAMLAAAEAERGPAILGGLTVDPDGRRNPTGVLGRFTLPWLLARTFGLGRLAGGTRPVAGDSPRPVPAVTGCCCMIRRELWDELGGFDESFFLFGEDVDLNLRILRRGGRALLVPSARFIHEGAASCRIAVHRQMRLLETDVLLMRKHWSPAAARAGCLLLKLGVLLRLASSRTGLGVRRLSGEGWAALWRDRSAWCPPGDGLGIRRTRALHR